MTKHDPDGRKPKTVRLSDAGIAEVQKVADKYGCDWTEAARRMIQYGCLGAPAEWPPSRWPVRTWGNEFRKD